MESFQGLSLLAIFRLYLIFPTVISNLCIFSLLDKIE